jgi:hypothetical protein
MGTRRAATGLNVSIGQKKKGKGPKLRDKPPLGEGKGKRPYNLRDKPPK